MFIYMYVYMFLGGMVRDWADSMDRVRGRIATAQVRQGGHRARLAVVSPCMLI